MNELEIFHFDDDSPNFESCGRENGFRYWLASDLMQWLDYSSMDPVRKAVNKALAACANLNIPISENFVEMSLAEGGVDWRLSRFACYLTVMNGDVKNPKVAQAQAYFITMAESFRQYIQNPEGVERVFIRGKLSNREKTLSGVVHTRNIENYQFFQNAGYRGMYNMNLAQIRQMRGLSQKQSPLDYMGKTELAANLFRLTQTEEVIKNNDVRGQTPLERTAENVGRTVRKTMIEISGTPPERLPASEDIKTVKSGLKHTHRQFAKLSKRPPDC